MPEICASVLPVSFLAEPENRGLVSVSVTLDSDTVGFFLLLLLLLESFQDLGKQPFCD